MIFRECSKAQFKSLRAPGQCATGLRMTVAFEHKGYHKILAETTVYQLFEGLVKQSGHEYFKILIHQRRVQRKPHRVRVMVNSLTGKLTKPNRNEKDVTNKLISVIRKMGQK